MNTKINELKLERLKDSEQRLQKINNLSNRQGVERTELLLEESEKSYEFTLKMLDIKDLLSIE